MNKYVFAAAAASIVMSAAAFAGPEGSTSNGQTDRKTGNAAVTFVDNYAFFSGFTTCNETQHRKWDTVSCTLSTPTSLTSGTYGWNSDFNGALGILTYTVSRMA